MIKNEYVYTPIRSGKIRYKPQTDLFIVATTNKDKVTTYTLILMNDEGELINTGVSATSQDKGWERIINRETMRIIKEINQFTTVSGIVLPDLNYTGTVGCYAVFNDYETAICFIKFLFLGTFSSIKIWKNDELISVKSGVIHEERISDEPYEEGSYIIIQSFPARPWVYWYREHKTHRLWAKELKRINDFLMKYD